MILTEIGEMEWNRSEVGRKGDRKKGSDGVKTLDYLKEKSHD